MNMKETKKMRRLIMCQSLDATTSCMIPNCRSVIRSLRSSDQTLSEHTRLLSNTKYIRLAERRGYVVPASRRSSLSSSSSTANGVKLDQNALQLSAANQVFQVQFKIFDFSDVFTNSYGLRSGLME
ncbi:hypothetical protein M8C21_007870 [Ambrosia artemisiifolia]|uniref:Uncharacterized protein n=1 Tax=Ambrosia artemisiifolia TaxID=4212 RepID=A0AAD5BKH5_AMBAR|nr:hypothetical protein M8C21_007870 [Ambrosia artemisiifolia]